MGNLSNTKMKRKLCRSGMSNSFRSGADEINRLEITGKILSSK